MNLLDLLLCLVTLHLLFQETNCRIERYRGYLIHHLEDLPSELQLCRTFPTLNRSFSS